MKLFWWLFFFRIHEAFHQALELFPKRHLTSQSKFSIFCKIEMQVSQISIALDRGKISYGFNRDYIAFFISHLISIWYTYLYRLGLIWRMIWKFPCINLFITFLKHIDRLDIILRNMSEILIQNSTMIKERNIKMSDQFQNQIDK
jgi:hypothetical protein